MKLTAILLVLVFAGIGTLGFIAMNHSDGHQGCIAATAQAVECPGDNLSLLGFISFHLNAFKSFSLALDSTLTIGLLLTLIAFLIFSFLRLEPADSISQALLNELRYRQRLSFSPFIPTQRFNHWLTLTEKRDPARLI
ncbi:MAG: hypothetical protein HYY99_00395 [Candidatus Colwellbacteria bacterium]|nr:hypothetical protein [Candidatus Colwellbacteria bacterium]